MGEYFIEGVGSAKENPIRVFFVAAAVASFAGVGQYVGAKMCGGMNS